MRYPRTRCNAEGWRNAKVQLSEPGIRGLRDKMLWEAEHITQFAGIEAAPTSGAKTIINEEIDRGALLEIIGADLCFECAKSAR